MGANDNATYHLAKLDMIRVMVRIVGKRVKVFKKSQEEALNLDDLEEDEDECGEGFGSEGDEG